MCLPPGAISARPGHHAVVVLRLFHLDLAQAVQPVGKLGGEFFGHVLHDHNARRHPWQAGQHRLQRLRATG
jgi:hypothetical protein